jgi:hypothetical protein
VKVCVQSSTDQGSTAYGVAVVNFATTPRTAIVEEAAEGIIAGVLGDRLRQKVIGTRVYQDTTLSARVMPISTRTVFAGWR